MAENRRRRLRLVRSERPAAGRHAASVDAVADALPAMFMAVAEAVLAGADAAEACDVAGRDLATLGVSLGEVLADLQRTTQLIAHRDPTFAESHALSLGWSEATLGYLHGLSCVDPLTGLATHAHLREVIASVYRDESHREYALVVIEVHRSEQAVSAARALTLVGQTARSVFAGDDTIGQVGSSRIVVMSPRTDHLAERVALLRRMLGQHAQRIWIEGLPATESSAVYVLDELARA